MPRYALPVDDIITWEMEDVVGEPGKWVIRTQQADEPIYENNQALRNCDYKGEFEFGRHVASIPLLEWNNWLKKYPILKDVNHDPTANKLLFKLIMQNSEVKVNNDRLAVPLKR